jgi:hypothetical protein
MGRQYREANQFFGYRIVWVARSIAERSESERDGAVATERGMKGSDQRGSSSVLAGEEDAAFDFGGAAPDAVSLTDANGVVEAGSLDVAQFADGLSPGFPAGFVVPRLKMRWGKEDRLQGSFARSFSLPFERNVLYFRHDAPPCSPR